MTTFLIILAVILVWIILGLLSTLVHIGSGIWERGGGKKPNLYHKIALLPILGILWVLNTVCR